MESLVVVGGEGRLTGVLRSEKEGTAAADLSATIGNDAWGTGTAIGVDIALNGALEAI